MSVVTRRIYHISAASTTLLNTQMGVEDSDDSDLGFRMWCGRDDVGIGPKTGTITKFLAKDQKARVTDLEATNRVLVTSGADVTASAASFTPSGDFDVETPGGTISLYSGSTTVTADGEINIEAHRNGPATTASVNLISNSLVTVDAGSVFSVEVGATGYFSISHDGISPDIKFADYNIVNNWTQQYVGLCDDGAEALQYQSDFGEVSIFAALHACLSGGGASATDTEIVYGTGSGITSSANMTFASDVLDLAGRLNVENISYGTETTATFASNTITANFSTGKDMQEVEIDANATTLSLTAPAGGSAKDMTLRIRADGAVTIGTWGNVWWDTNGTNLATSTLAIASGDYVVIKLMYDGSQWYGWIHEFDPPG
jgi:hypothetical protein